MSDVVREGWFYLGTFLKDDKYEPETGTCTLLTRYFKVTRGPKGRLTLYRQLDAEDFPDEEAMLAAIEGRSMVELPPEADGNPRYVPVGFRLRRGILS